MKREYLLGVILLVLATAPVLISDDVLQHHRNATRDGLYIDPLITRSAARTTHLDPNFDAPLPGPTYAQPLYVTNGPGGLPAFIVATEQNIVLALAATNGSQIWQANLGTPVQRSWLCCGNIDPVGITGTPVIDPNSRAIYVDAMTTPDGGMTVQHLIYALSLDDGSVLPGWPVNVTGIRFDGFNPGNQNQRGALLLNSGVLGNFLYVPYGGHYGDCCDYHGWVVTVPVNNPGSASGWATEAFQGGIWAPGGLSTDGNSIFASTGNTRTLPTDTWKGGEAIIRLRLDGTFSGDPSDFFTPSNWQVLDMYDEDLGSSGPLLVDVPGATPSQLVVALGKNGVAYLLDRNNLGGIGTGDGIYGEGLYSMKVADDEIINAAATYTTASGTYVVFNSTGYGVGCPGAPGDLVAFRIGAAAPPSINVAWCANNLGRGSPIVTTTDGTSQPIVWLGSESSMRLHAFDGETGEVLFSGGGPDEQMIPVQRFQTPIAVNGRIFVAADDRLLAFTTQ